jgi:hypothetical protein
MSNNFFSKILWFIRQCKKNIITPDTPQMTIWLMRVAFWIAKATNTHSVHVILTDFPMQHWLHQGAAMFCFTGFSCLVIDEAASWQELKAVRHRTYPMQQSCSSAAND